MQSVVGVAMVPEAILEKLEPMCAIMRFTPATPCLTLSPPSLHENVLNLLVIYFIYFLINQGNKKVPSNHPLRDRQGINEQWSLLAAKQPTSKPQIDTMLLYQIATFSLRLGCLNAYKRYALHAYAHNCLVIGKGSLVLVLQLNV